MLNFRSDSFNRPSEVLAELLLSSESKELGLSFNPGSFTIITILLLSLCFVGSSPWR